MCVRKDPKDRQQDHHLYQLTVVKALAVFSKLEYFLGGDTDISVGSCNWTGNWTSWYQPTVVRALAVFSQLEYFLWKCRL